MGQNVKNIYFWIFGVCWGGGGGGLQLSDWAYFAFQPAILSPIYMIMSNKETMIIVL